MSGADPSATDLFAAYGTPRFFCEIMNALDPSQPTVALLRDRLRGFDLDELRRRATAAEAELYNLGITFTVYSERDSIDRILPFDLIPRILTATEWDVVERGVVQRVTAINQFLWDIYHDQKILKDNILPRDLVLGNSNFRPEMMGLDVPLGVYVHVNGTDIVRDENGRFLVLEDNARTPSGVSYVIENRHMMLRVLPDLVAGIGLRGVDEYGMRLQQAMAAMAPAHVADPQVVLLSPGIYNAAYFEHVFLAREMGVPLVEGRDLVVEDARVYMRTIAGLRPVHAIYRRLNDDFLDPDVFRPDSQLGVRGLVDAWRRGNVAIANAVGTGVADDKAIYAYMPRIIRYYLDQEPILDNVETNICREPSGLQYTLDNLERLVVKPVGESGGYGMIIGPHATRDELNEFRTKLLADPANYISQPVINLSTAPTLCEDGVQARHVDLRPFAITGNSTWVLPGGLSRVALKKGSLVVNSSQGGGSKGHMGAVVMSEQPARTLYEPPGAGQALLSRYAESTVWLARYMERIENLARIIDVTDTFTRTSTGENGWRSVIQINADEEQFFGTHQRADVGNVAEFYVLDRDNPNSIASLIQVARENARTLRPLISTEMWTHINMFHKWVRTLTRRDIGPSQLSSLCARMKQECQTHYGITEGTFYRDQGWYFYVIGKSLERGNQTTRLVDIKYHTLLPREAGIGSQVDMSQWSAVLRSAAAYHAYRRMMPRSLTPAAVAGFLLLNNAFPRSLALTLRQVNGAVGQLRTDYGLRRGGDALERMDELRASLQDQTIQQIIVRGLHEFLDWVQMQLHHIHDEIGHAFWSFPATPSETAAAAEPASVMTQRIGGMVQGMGAGGGMSQTMGSMTHSIGAPRPARNGSPPEPIQT